MRCVCHNRVLVTRLDLGREVSDQAIPLTAAAEKAAAAPRLFQAKVPKQVGQLFTRLVLDMEAQLQTFVLAKEVGNFARLSSTIVVELVLLGKVTKIVLVANTPHSIAAATWETAFNYHQQNEPKEQELGKHPEDVGLDSQKCFLISFDRISIAILVLTVGRHRFKKLWIEKHGCRGVLHRQNFAIVVDVVADCDHVRVETHVHSHVRQHPLNHNLVEQERKNGAQLSFKQVGAYVEEWQHHKGLNYHRSNGELHLRLVCHNQVDGDGGDGQVEQNIVQVACEPVHALALTVALQEKLPF